MKNCERIEKQKSQHAAHKQSDVTRFNEFENELISLVIISTIVIQFLNESGISIEILIEVNIVL